MGVQVNILFLCFARITGPITAACSNLIQITQIFLLPPSFLTFNIPRASPTESIFYYPAMICRLPSVILALPLWLPEEKQWNGVIVPASSHSFFKEKKKIFQNLRAELRPVLNIYLCSLASSDGV